MGKVIALIACIPILIALHGFTVQMLWGWFVVTTFDASPLSFGSAVGLALIVSYLTNVQDVATKDRDFLDALIFASTRPVAALIAGWTYVLLFTVS